MVKLPRLRIPPPGLLGLPLPSSVKGRIIAGFGGSSLLAREHRSQLAEMGDLRAKPPKKLLHDVAWFGGAPCG